MSIVPRYMASHGVCPLFQLWSVPANLRYSIVKVLYFSGYHSVLLFRFQFKKQSGGTVLCWFSSVPVGSCRDNDLTHGIVKYNH
jgi:hypothetical protein